MMFAIKCRSKTTLSLLVRYDCIHPTPKIHPRWEVERHLMAFRIKQKCNIPLLLRRPPGQLGITLNHMKFNNGKDVS